MFELSTCIASPQQLAEADLSAYDALYLGDFSCREYPDNFSSRPELLADAIKTIKDRGQKAYLRLYAVPGNQDLGWVREMIEAAMTLPLDALEVHNLGILRILKEMGSELPVHLGVFGNLYTHETARVMKDFGVVRVYPNPELSINEIIYIAKETPIDVLVPVHGKMPLVVSETCFIIEHANGCSAADCGHLCAKDHWLTRGEGEWSLKDTGRMTLSGKDLCMIEHLDALAAAGLTSFFVQGHGETMNYLSKVGPIYRRALEDAFAGRDTGDFKDDVDALTALSRMGLCNGYYFETAGRRYLGRV